MKKLINSPDRVVDEALAGMVAAHARPDPGRVTQHHRAQGRTPLGQGRRHLRWRLGPRADARRVRRAGHARCRLSGCRLHVAGPGPDAGSHQGGRRRSRRPPHRQELHRRHHELRDRRRDWPVPRASRSRRSSSPTTSPSRIRSTPRVAVASAAPCSPRRSSVRRPKPVPTWRRSRRSARRSRTTSARWAWPSRAAPSRLPASRPSRSATTRWRSASASTASRVVAGSSSAPADEIVEMLVGPILDDGLFNRGDTVLAFVNGMGGTPLIELYIVYRKVAEILAGKGITIGRQPRRQLHHLARDGRDCRSPCSSWTTS